jgi:hypothetical protein
MSNAGKTRAQVIGHASCPVPAEKSQKSLDAVFEEVYYSQAGDFRGWDAHVRCRGSTTPSCRDRWIPTIGLRAVNDGRRRFFIRSGKNFERRYLWADWDFLK